MTHISINPSIRVRGLLENAQWVCGLHRHDETCGCLPGSARCGWPGARSQSLARTSAQARRRGGPLSFIHARGVNAGTKTPILLIVGAFGGGGGAGRWRSPSAVSRQEIDFIRGTYSLFCSRLHICPLLFFFYLSFVFYATYSFIHVNLTLALILAQ